MGVGIVVPNRGQKKSILDTVAQVGGIASDVYGLYKGVQDNARAEKEAERKNIQFQDQQQDRADERDAGSQRSAMLRGVAKSSGLAVNDTDSGEALKSKYGDFSTYNKDKAETDQKIRLARATKAAEHQDGTRLPADKVLNVQGGGAILGALPDLQQTIDSNEGLFGPVMGRVGSMNPYDEEAQTIDAQMRAQSQAFGRHMEGGVLRKEDEEKYRKMFPQLTDTPAVAKNKLQLVERMLAQKQSSDIQALKQSGYDTKGLRAPDGLPGIPQAIVGIKPPPQSGAFGEAQAGPEEAVRVHNGRTYIKVNGGWKGM